MAADTTTILLSLGSSILTAGVTTFFNKNKTEAEVAKIKAETDKILAETKSLSTQVSQVNPSNNFDVIYYDGSEPSAFDFDVEKNKEWDNTTKKEVGEIAAGNFTIFNKVISIERTNTQGRFNLLLKKYNIPDTSNISDTSNDYIKSNLSLGQQRKIEISCDVKSSSKVKHVLDFVLRQIDTYDWLAKETFEVTKSEWITITAYLRVFPNKDFRLKIYDRQVSAPSSIQIRNLKVIERF